MKNLKITLVGLLMVAATALSAQSFELSYQTSLPLGDIDDFAGNYSWRGMGMDYEWFINDYLSAGAGVGWNVFTEETGKDFEYNYERNGMDRTIQGKQYRYLNAVPFYATVKYYLGEAQTPRPFVGASIGGTWIEKYVEIGVLGMVEKNTHFTFIPRVGYDIPFSYRTSATISLTYNIAPPVNDSDFFQYLGINLGLKFM